MGLENKGRTFGSEEATGNVPGAGKGRVGKNTGEGSLPGGREHWVLAPKGLKG